MILSLGDFDDPQVIDLLRLHLAGMQANSPAGSVYALDLSGLRRPDISFYVARDESGAVLGCGALRELSPHEGEIKSMRTHPDHLGKGVGKAVLSHLVDTARRRGYHRVSLETGTGAAFEAATGLYRAFGFEPGAPFGDYAPSDFNRFFHLTITE